MSMVILRRGTVCIGLISLLGCGSSPINGPDPAEPPPGPDVSTPFAIDRGDDGSDTPGSYKGLPLRLVTRPAPQVTPVDGVIGVVCVGMSNGNQECSEWITQTNGPWRAEINPVVRIVNCAVGGNAIEKWIDPESDALLWDACVNTKLAQSGVRLDQVRVVYHKAANQFTTAGNGAALPLYPAMGSDYAAFLANLQHFAGRVHTKFPAVQAVYTSSRSYGGFSTSTGRGEPLSYEEGHALNSWLTTHAAIEGVWYGWGAYLWAPDCASGQSNASGTCYVRSDYQSDGVHPAEGGRLKIARLVHDRFREEAWYRP